MPWASVTACCLFSSYVPGLRLWLPGPARRVVFLVCLFGVSCCHAVLLLWRLASLGRLVFWFIGVVCVLIWMFLARSAAPLCDVVRVRSDCVVIVSVLALVFSHVGRFRAEVYGCVVF